MSASTLASTLAPMLTPMLAPMLAMMLAPTLASTSMPSAKQPDQTAAAHEACDWTCFERSNSSSTRHRTSPRASGRSEQRFRCPNIAVIVANGSGFTMAATPPTSLAMLSRPAPQLLLLVRPPSDRHQISSALTSMDRESGCRSGGDERHARAARPKSQAAAGDERRGHRAKLGTRNSSAAARRSCVVSTRLRGGASRRRRFATSDWTARETPRRRAALH